MSTTRLTQDTIRCQGFNLLDIVALVVGTILCIIIKASKPPTPAFSALLQIYRMNRCLFQKMSSTVKGVRSFHRLSPQRISDPKPQLAAACRSLSTFTTTGPLSLLPTSLNSISLRFKSTAPATASYDLSVDSFPSIVIGPDRVITPQGSFAEAQAQVGYFLM